jgi:hypothetical protein
LTRAAVHRPAVTLLLAAICTALGVVGTARIHPTGSLESMLSRSEPSARALAEIIHDFGVMDDLILLITDESTDPSPVIHGRLRSFGERLQRHARESPTLAELCVDVFYRDVPEIRAFIETEIVPAGLYYLSDEQFAELASRLSPEGIRDQVRENETLVSAGGPAAHALSKTILRDPLRLHHFLFDAIGRSLPLDPTSGSDLVLSDDGRTLMIRLRGARPAADLDFAQAFVAEAREIIRDTNVDGLAIELTGAYAIAVTAERSIRGDMIRSITGSLILLGLLFLLVYRNPLSFPVAVTPVAVGIICAFGASSFYSTELTPIVAVIGAILAGLAIDYAIHFLSHAGRQMAAGESNSQAVVIASRDIGPAMVAACLTSMIAFLAIAFSSIRALRQFALIGALGLAGALLAALTVLPAILASSRITGRAIGQRRTSRDHAAGFLNVLRPRRTHSMFAAGFVGLAACTLVWQAPGGTIPFEDDLTVMHPRPNPPLDAQRSLPDRFGRHPEPLLVSLHAAAAGDLVTRAHEVAARLEGASVRKTGIAGVVGLSTILPDPRTLEARRAAVKTLDANRILADFETAIAESIFDPQALRDYTGFLRRFLTNEDPPTMSTLARYPRLASLFLPRDATTSPDSVTGALTLVFPNVKLDDRHARAKLVEALRTALAGLPGVTLTGMAAVAHDTEHLIRTELARVFEIAGIVVVVGIAIYFRRIRDAILALVPAAFGLVCLLGVMHATGQKFNMVNLVGVPLVVGLGVDDGIFLVSVFRARRASRGSAFDSYAAAVHAILMTTLTTMVSFGSLIFTSTPAIQSLGILMTVGMTACLAGAFFLLLPILLAKALDDAAPPEATDRVNPAIVDR